MTLYQIGNITLPAVWIAVLIALAVCALAWRLISGEKIGEWYWNAFTLYFLVWKASYILFNFEEFLNFPMSALYFNGGVSGHILAIAALSVYLLRAAKKHPGLCLNALSVLLLFFIGFEATLATLEQQLTPSVLHTLLFVSIAAFLYASRKKAMAPSMQFYVLFVLAEVLILSLFQPFLSAAPLTFSWLVLTAFALARFRKSEVIIHE
jgi:hypothetical protein